MSYEKKNIYKPNEYDYNFTYRINRYWVYNEMAYKSYLIMYPYLTRSLHSRLRSSWDIVDLDELSLLIILQIF